MNTIAAVCSATWCAASATVPMMPMSSAADANTPCSSRNVAEIGSPIAISWRNNGQSLRQMWPRTWYFLNGADA
jgi:hypothetical protein